MTLAVEDSEPIAREYVLSELSFPLFYFIFLFFFLPVKA